MGDRVRGWSLAWSEEFDGAAGRSLAGGTPPRTGRDGRCGGWWTSGSGGSPHLGGTPGLPTEPSCSPRGCPGSVMRFRSARCFQCWTRIWTKSGARAGSPCRSFRPSLRNRPRAGQWTRHDTCWTGWPPTVMRVPFTCSSSWRREPPRRMIRAAATELAVESSAPRRAVDTPGTDLGGTWAPAARCTWRVLPVDLACTWEAILAWLSCERTFRPDAQPAPVPHPD